MFVELPLSVVCRFQELDLSVATFTNVRESPREAEWANIVLNGLHADSQYSEVSFFKGIF